MPPTVFPDRRTYNVLHREPPTVGTGKKPPTNLHTFDVGLICNKKTELRRGSNSCNSVGKRNYADKINRNPVYAVRRYGHGRPETHERGQVYTSNKGQ